MVMNPAGYVPLLDGGNPRIVTGKVFNTTISGGMFVFASGASGVVSSGADSFATTDVTVEPVASGGQFNGIALATATSGNLVSFATRGAVIVQDNAGVTCGVKVKCDGTDSVADCGAGEGEQSIGRALTQGASGGYVIVDIQG